MGIIRVILAACTIMALVFSVDASARKRHHHHGHAKGIHAQIKKALRKCNRDHKGKENKEARRACKKQIRQGIKAVLKGHPAEVEKAAEAVVAEAAPEEHAADVAQGEAQPVDPTTAPEVTVDPAAEMPAADAPPADAPAETPAA